MIKPNTDDPAYLLKLHKNLMIMIVILSSFASYYSFSFCISIEKILHKIGSHCPLFLLLKKKG